MSIETSIDVTVKKHHLFMRDRSSIQSKDIARMCENRTEFKWEFSERLTVCDRCFQGLYIGRNKIDGRRWRRYMQKLRESITMVLVRRPHESLESDARVYPGQIWLNRRARTKAILVRTTPSLKLELCFQWRKIGYYVDDAVYVASLELFPRSQSELYPTLFLCAAISFVVYVLYKRLPKVHRKFGNSY